VGGDKRKTFDTTILARYTIGDSFGAKKKKRRRGLVASSSLDVIAFAELL
jgi:hypothetical protein